MTRRASLAAVSRKNAVVLVAAGLWSLWVWVTRVMIMSGQSDATLGFKLVHGALAAVSIAFGIAVGWIGLSAIRRSRKSGSHPRKESG